MCVHWCTEKDVVGKTVVEDVLSTSVTEHSIFIYLIFGDDMLIITKVVRYRFVFNQYGRTK